MRKTIFIAVVLAFMAAPALADLTTINATGSDPTEPSLIGTGGILDTLYGLGNLTRIQDFNHSPNDQVWMNLNGGGVATAKWAATTETFGYIAGDSGGTFVGLFSVPSGTNSSSLSGYTGTVPGSATMPTFRWALDSGSPGPGFGVKSSRQSDNPDGDDNMVTWLITGGASEGNYVIAWEVEGLGDGDYQDLVVEISKAAPVPVPGAVLLGMLGLSVVGVKLRKRA